MEVSQDFSKPDYKFQKWIWAKEVISIAEPLNPSLRLNVPSFAGGNIQFFSNSMIRNILKQWEIRNIYIIVEFFKLGDGYRPPRGGGTPL